MSHRPDSSKDVSEQLALMDAIAEKRKIVQVRIVRVLMPDLLKKANVYPVLQQV